MNTDEGQLQTQCDFDLATSEGRIGALARAAQLLVPHLGYANSAEHFTASEQFDNLLASIRQEIYLQRGENSL